MEENVRPNTEGIGTDLNRNYGLGWAVDNNGSSPSGGSETFRGAGAFSESETKAMKYLCATKEFRIALNYHAFGDYLIIPWGYLDRPTEDSVQYLALANDFTKFNKFQVGTTQQTLAYGVNGVSDDWMYGAEDLNQKILAFTPEVGHAF
ncbi:MAG: peptidase M14, partial [Saprospiraceae bacterium]|nr:peptidase M14 [Saprospiraceae bacterium]